MKECMYCDDFGITEIAHECAISCMHCTRISRPHFNEKHDPIHRVFHWSVPKWERSTLNETYGILYAEFLKGKNPPSYEADLH